MRFHILAVPHTVTNDQYSACAFTQKILKFGKMMINRGHHLIHYGHEDSNLQCDENVIVITNKDLEIAYGTYDWKNNFFKYDVNDHAYKTYYKNTIEEIKKRKQPHDFILPFWGAGVKPICDAHNDLICVEPGIGYAQGHWTKWKIFESYAIMNAYYGLASVGRCQQSWYDIVIPNYFDLDEFKFRDDKDDFFLFIGRVYEGKGIHIAIQMTAIIGVELYVCGQGKLKDCGYETIPEHVKEIGYVGKNHRRILMSKAKCGIVASLYNEPFGGTQVEFLLSGTPTITTDWGAFTENNLHGITGFRCRTFDEFCWAGKNIDQIKPSDCRSWGLRYSLESIAPRYERFFNYIHDIYKHNGWYTKYKDRKNFLLPLPKNLNLQNPY